MKFHKMKKYASQAGWATASLVLSVPAFAEAADPFTAVKLDDVATKVGATGLLIVGIAMALKGISLAKRAIAKA